MFKTERRGFEPLEAFTSAVFKTAAIDHSAISPLTVYDKKKPQAWRPEVCLFRKETAELPLPKRLSRGDLSLTTRYRA